MTNTVYFHNTNRDDDEDNDSVSTTTTEQSPATSRRHTTSGEILSSSSVTHTPLREGGKLEISLSKSFSFKELRSATSNFHHKNSLGQGAFGMGVFKGWIDENKLVATKPGKSWQVSIVYPFWKSSAVADEDPRRSRDGLSWYKDAGRHAYGDFSMAIVQANNLLEDQSQIESGSLSSLESGPQGTFVGIYDGHGGPETSRFVTENLFHCMKNIASEHQGMSDDVIKQAFLSTEEEFLGLVRKQWLTKPQIASVGSCCLVGVICNGTMYIANAGDSRVVLGRLDKTSKDVKAMQLSTEHIASLESVREELRSTHPDDSDIVVLRRNVWRVKGIIQISRSIGDAYLKNAKFNKEPLLPKFRLTEPFSKPILKAEPTVLVEKLTPQDQFLIFASDGLWEHLTNQEAVNIVNQNTRHGIARRLVKTALQEVAKKREMRYTKLKKIVRGVRRHFHDDITVIVLFLEANLISKTSFPHSKLSLRGWSGVTQVSTL